MVKVLTYILESNVNNLLDSLDTASKSMNRSERISKTIRLRWLNNVFNTTDNNLLYKDRFLNVKVVCRLSDGYTHLIYHDNLKRPDEVVIVNHQELYAILLNASDVASNTHDYHKQVFNELVTVAQQRLNKKK